jgi:hypothetical protein
MLAIPSGLYHTSPGWVVTGEAPDQVRKRPSRITAYAHAKGGHPNVLEQRLVMEGVYGQELVVKEDPRLG